jgi:4-amino-4-deoxy-L-arabinose transferase-like glycosyltransferase
VKRRLSNPDLIPIAIAGAVGALLCAIDLGTRSLWLDEGSTFAIVSQHGAALWRGIKNDGGNMLLYYLGMHFVVAWFGDATWVMRLPSVIANGLTGALVAAVALRLFGANRRLAAAAGLLAVVSLPLVFWGQNVRGYAWLVTLSVGSFLALIVILQTPADRSPSRAAVVAYVLTTLAALYIGYDVALLIPAQLALLLIHRERARLVIGCLALTALLCVPLLVLAAERGSGQLFWVPSLSWQVAGQAALALFSAGFDPNFHRTATTAPTVIVMAVAVFAGLALAIRAVRQAGREHERSGPLLFILAWVLIPTALTLVAYAAGEPIELSRVTILELPALALLVAWLLLRPQVMPAVGTAAVAVLLALRLLQVIPSYGVSSEPWNAVTAYVLKATPARGTTCVAFYAQDGREAFDYYLLHTTRLRQDPWPNLRPVLPSLPWGSIRPYVEAYGTLNLNPPAQRARVARECPRFWLITSHSGESGGTHQSLVNLERYHALDYGLRRLYPHTSLRKFGWASPINVRLLWR